MGLTEEDIEAMQAVTAARTAIANIQKEQINIKKNISDTKIKQYQLEQTDAKILNAKNGVNPDGTPQIGSAYDMGKSIIDSIFESATLAPAAVQPAYSAPTESAAMEADQAADFLDSIINNNDAGMNVTPATQYERLNPKTYVKIGNQDSDVSYETYAADGTLLPDYPNPTAKITHIDREAGIATNELMMSFQLKTEDSYDEIPENESTESGFGSGSDTETSESDSFNDI
jgi:hypothetical protein